MNVPDPTQPLPNKRWEIYATLRSKGLDQATSWRRTIPFGTRYKGSNTSLRVSGHRCERRPEVKGRIDWLIAKDSSRHTDIPEALSRSDIIAASLEVSEALEAAYKACLNATTVIPPQARERLKAVWAGHLARQGKMDDEQELPLNNEWEPAMAALTDYIGKVCTCPIR